MFKSLGLKQVREHITIANDGKVTVFYGFDFVDGVNGTMDAHAVNFNRVTRMVKE